MDNQFTYVIKEEIIRNVLKTHDTILIAGWPGTGKTVSTLKAVRDIPDAYYYNGSDPAAGPLISHHNASVKVLGDVSDFRGIGTGEPLLIVDDADKISGAALETAREILSHPPDKGKIILITKNLLDVKDLLPFIKVVVRLKKNTAEMIYTDLLPA